MTTVFDEALLTGVYAAAYTPQNELAANTVLPQNFTLVSESGETAVITEAYYYAEANQVKLILETANAGSEELWNLASTGLLDTEGNQVNTAEGITLFKEAEISYGTAQVSSVTFFENGVPTLSTANKDGIIAVVRIANTTGESVSGMVKLYDGNTLVAECNCSIESESFTEVSIDISEHNFTNEASLSLSAS